MKFKDYYKILGVEKTSTVEEIKKAYRAKARKYHPDKNPGSKESEDMFKDISEAYEVLGDKDKKAKYDNLGSSYNNFKSTGGGNDQFDWSKWAANNSGSSGGRKQTFGDYVNTGGGISDFFDNIFGGNGGGQRADSFQQRKNVPKKGEDFRTEMDLTLEECFAGVSKRFKVNDESIEIKFLPGIADKQELRIPKKGYTGKFGGANGDLIITIKVIEHPTLKREGNDIHEDLNVDLFTSILGGKVKYKSLIGTIEVNIPSESQNGKLLKLKKLGIPVYKNPTEKGDLILKLNILIPINLTEKEKELFNEIKQLNGKVIAEKV